MTRIATTPLSVRVIVASQPAVRARLQSMSFDVARDSLTGFRAGPDHARARYRARSAGDALHRSGLLSRLPMRHAHAASAHAVGAPPGIDA